MIGIKQIGTYIPARRISNLDRAQKYETDPAFILEKIGIRSVAIKEPGEKTSDMAVKAFKDLQTRELINLGDIDVLILITQNPDSKIPHTSAVIHGLLGLPESCAAFDVSLGCSGYVYGLSIIKSFMEENGLRKGLLFTCDPYSEILDENDKNTSLLFGDAATVTYMTSDPVYSVGRATFGTIGNERHNLTCENETLFMNGRGIFNFAAQYIPKDVKSVLTKNSLDLADIDKVIFHQGSKFILETLIKRLGLNAGKVENDIFEYGNTVSSSIPIILSKFTSSNFQGKILISGFGVGLSWSSNILTYVQ